MVNIKTLTLNFSDEFAIVDFLLHDGSQARVVFAPGIKSDDPEDKYLVSSTDVSRNTRLRYVADRVIAAAVAAAIGEEEKPAEEAANGV